MLPNRDVPAQVVGGEIGVGGQEGSHNALVLGGRDRARGVDKRTARPHGRRARGPDPGLQFSQSRWTPRLSPARVRASGERSEVAARWVDEDPVEGRVLRLRGVLRAYLDDRRPHARGGPAERVGAALVALDGDDLALVA